MNKIIIFSYPSSGSNILKVIMSHIDDVFITQTEQFLIYDEQIKEAEKKRKKNIICNCTILSVYYRAKERYDDYIKIFLIRNPFFIRNPYF